MANDNKTKVIVNFSAEKATALRMYLDNKGLNLENELIKTLEILFEKNVPNQVKEYILRKEEGLFLE